MRKYALLAWCLAPLAVILFHFTTGQRLWFAEKSVPLRLLGEKAELAGNYKKAVEHYLSAESAAHPKDLVLRTRLRIDAARALMLDGSPLEAAEQIDLLLEPRRGRPLPTTLVAEARSTLALALYYAAYTLRLESSSPDMWKSEADGAYQIFRDLYQSEIRTEQKTLSVFYARNLEASVRLARARKGELASLPVPEAARAALERGVASKKRAAASE
ncbi:MAG: hypothetical protein DVB28_001269 [Verrucomicrobia bacterium]|jgi:hypothetical protein|nr:MAG: hypothetical protein DVB28_001269 [Verrucomicrobiota bacterium]